MAIERFERAKQHRLEVSLLTEPIRCRLVERREDDRNVYATVPIEPSGKPLGIAVGPAGESIAHEYGTRVLVSEDAKAFVCEAMPNWFDYDDERARALPNASRWLAGRSAAPPAPRSRARAGRGMRGSGHTRRVRARAGETPSERRRPDQCAECSRADVRCGGLSAAAPKRSCS